MRPIHAFLILVFIGLIVLAVWLWLHQGKAPAEIDLAMDPRRPVVEEPVVEIDEAPAPIVVTPPVVEPVVPLVGGPIEPKFDFGDADCRWLVRHVPDADVAYEPGVDVHGNPVVPADLYGTYDMNLPRTITASVSRRLLGHPNLRQETPFADVEIDTKTGAIWINGQGLDSAEHDALVAYCRNRP